MGEAPEQVLTPIAVIIFTALYLKVFHLPLVYQQVFPFLALVLFLSSLPVKYFLLGMLSFSPIDDLCTDHYCSNGHNMTSKSCYFCFLHQTRQIAILCIVTTTLPKTNVHLSGVLLVQLVFANILILNLLIHGHY
jgi:hypothetical protein